MNKNRKMVIVFLFAFVLCFSLVGCTLQDRIEEYSSGKEQCYLNTENVTRFSYKGNTITPFWQIPYQMAGLENGLDISGSLPP